MSRDQQFGLEGEKWVMTQLKKRGYKPTLRSDFYVQACDLLVNGLCIEVKIAKPTLRLRKLKSGNVVGYTRWQWFVHPTSQQLSNEWLLVLLAQTNKAIIPFILPGSQIGDRTHIQITSHPNNYKGWLAAYRNAWDMVAYLTQETYLDNGPTYEQWSKMVA